MDVDGSTAEIKVVGESVGIICTAYLRLLRGIVGVGGSIGNGILGVTYTFVAVSSVRAGNNGGRKHQQGEQQT